MTRSRGWGPTLVVLLLAVAGVAAYLLVRSDDADDPFADYCDAVVDHREEIGAARSAGATTGLLRALPAFEELAEEAPQDIRDEWRTVVDRVRDLRDALDDAGVDAASYDPAKPPEGLTGDQEEAIETAAVRLGADDTAAALAGVEQQARDVCKTPLSL